MTSLSLLAGWTVTARQKPVSIKEPNHFGETSRLVCALVVRMQQNQVFSQHLGPFYMDSQVNQTVITVHRFR